MRAVSLGPTLPRTLRGTQNAVAVENLSNFTVRDAGASKMLQSMYAGTSDQVLNGAGRETFEAVALLQSIQKTPYQPAGGRELSSAAALATACGRSRSSSKPM